MFHTGQLTAACRLMSVIILSDNSVCIVNIAAAVHASSIVMQCQLCVRRELQSVSTRVYNNTTLNVVVEWRQLAAICVNVYVQVRA